VFLATFIANALGYVSIASLVGNTLLSSAYIAVVFYVAVRIADGLIMFASRVRPLRLLGMVHRHRSMLRRRIRRVLQWLAIIGWFVLTLDSLSLRGPVIDRVRAILTADLTIGALSVSLGDVLVFALTVWAAFLLSRFIRFLLEEDVYPRAGLTRGVPYAISTMLHYVILLVGFFVAIAAMGFDMTKFTILAGAFGVGLGFGMQNIVNNFVSGLILLFERPVKVGDVIQLEDTGGAVESIGIRASLIRTWDSSEIIVPNSKLISERVTNWTYSSRQRGIEIIVGVEYGTNSRRVIELLLEIGEAHPSVTDAPPPQAFFTDFGADSINFALRAWTDDFQKWQQMRSDLVVAIYEKFNAEGITIPNTQRDLHLRSIDPEAVKAIKSYSTSEDRSNDEDHAIEDSAPAQNKASGTKK
jgi:small-conductance mechanosensitive channel